MNVDEHIRACGEQQLLSEGDVVTDWIALCAVRSPQGGGYVIPFASPNQPPPWLLLGVLRQATAALETGLVPDD